MLLNVAFSLLIASATVHQCAADEEASANELPILLKQEFSTVEYGALEKRDTCPGGGQCLIGTCCGDGCASNCCGHDEGGVGCGIAQRCNFDGNVFIGCCANLIGGCTGTPTMITINTPYRTVTIKTDAPTTYSPPAPTADVTSGTGLSTDVDSSLSTASAASTRTTSTSTPLIGDLTTTTDTGRSTTTSDDRDLSTSETTSSAVSTITSNSVFGSESSSSSDSEATATEGAAAEETTASTGAASRSFGVVEVGPLLAFGAWFLGTA